MINEKWNNIFKFTATALFVSLLASTLTACDENLPEEDETEVVDETPTDPTDETPDGEDGEPEEEVVGSQIDPAGCPEHNPLGVSVNTDQLLCWENYSVGYNYETLQPDWASYFINKDLVNRFIERTDDFRDDFSVPAYARSTLGMYRGSGYDRGHIAPAATVGYDEESMSLSFLLSNMSPQDAGFNRGGWAELEALVRDCVNQTDTLLVITGSIYTSDEPTYAKIDSGPYVPDAYYKILVKTTEPMKALAFNVPHVAFSGSFITDYVTSINAIEALTGQDFLPALDDAIEEDFEASFEDFCGIAPGLIAGSDGSGSVVQ